MYQVIRSGNCLPTFLLALCVVVVPAAIAQKPASDLRQVPLLLELTETVTSERVKPSDSVHFRVIEDIVADGLTVVAKGTAVTGKADHFDKHDGPAKTPALWLRFSSVGTVTGDELLVTSAAGKQNGGLEKLAMEAEDWPGVRGFLGRVVHYARPGTRLTVPVTLPPQLDRARYVAAQPARGAPPGYATVYFFGSEFDVWCGAVEIGRSFSKVLLRPGKYSCRAESFSPNEAYLDFDVADGGTYYLLADGDSLNLSLGTSAEVIKRWNEGGYPIPADSEGADLTKLDSEIFRKLPPFVCAEQRECGSQLRITESFAGAAGFFDRGAESFPPGSATNSVAQTSTSNSPQTKQIILELTDKVSSRNAMVGNEVHFRVVEDVIRDSLVVIAKGTTIKGKVERVDKRGGWMKEGGLILQTGLVNTVAGEDLPVASMLGQKGGGKDVKGGLAVSVEMAPATPFVLPFLPFMKGNDYELQSGTRVKAEVTLPSQFDRARYLVAQPPRETPPGYATVYFLPPVAFSYALFDVWCGAVEIGGLGRTLWRPGKYSCRVEAFSPRESYVDFTFSDGETYYVTIDCKDACAGPEDRRPSFTTAAATVAAWNGRMLAQPSGTTGDLTEIDPEIFRKLPPFSHVKQQPQMRPP